MNLCNKIAAAFVVTTVIAGISGAVVTTPASAAEAYCVTRTDTGIPGGRDDLNITSQLVDIRGDDRGECVKNVADRAFEQAGKKYNVLVANLSLDYDQRLNGVKFYGTFVREGVYYGIWVFEDGQFYNHGDGGWQNWGMRGSFTSLEQGVEFHRLGS
jgi:hypothetical protein